MGWGAGFDWLDGTVTVPAPMPPEWGTSIFEFYRVPNDERWAGSLCRVLYHETIHFWQFLSSAYLANLVQAEWLRLRAFEDSGRWPPVDEAVAALGRTAVGRPFSAMELLECWARYWDVHTRHPGRILREEGIDALHSPGPGGGYSSAQFDRFMQHGRDAAVYARPYRWALERAGGRSKFVNLVLPTIMFCAFGSPDPVAVFVAALDRALKSSEVDHAVRNRSDSINLDWLDSYHTVIREAVTPSIQVLGMPDFTAGWDVLARGRLGEHPIYRIYLRRVQKALDHVRLFSAVPSRVDSIENAIHTATTAAAVRDPLVLFMFPGQPGYRSYLGWTVPPPRVRFADIVWHAEVEVGAEALSMLLPRKDLEPNSYRLDARYAPLDKRLQRFRDAEYAVRRGLPLTTFTR